MKIAVSQIGIDVKLSLAAPDGAELASVDLRGSGDEVLPILLPVDGPCELRIAPGGDKLPAGRYAVIAEAIPDDDGHRSALKHLLEGRRLADQGKDRLRDARKEFEAARDAWARAGDGAMSAWCGVEVGRLSDRLQEPAASKEAYADAARRFTEAGRTADAIDTRNHLGEAIGSSGDSKGAVEVWKSILPSQDLLTPADRTVLLYNYGRVVRETGEYDESIRVLSQVVPQFHDFGMPTGELLGQVELASTYVAKADLVPALKTLTRGLEMSRELSRPDMEARFLQRLGLVYWDMGDDVAAVERWQRALALHRAGGNRIGEAAVLLLLGDDASRHDDLQTAEANYKQALEVFQATGSQDGEARALSRLGGALTKRGDYPAAIERQSRALEIQRRLGNRQSEVLAMLGLARATAGAGDRTKAKSLLDEAFSISHGSAGRMADWDILGELAIVQGDDGDMDKALETVERAIALVEAKQREALVPSLKTSVSGEAAVWNAVRTDLLMRRHLAAPKAGWDAKGFESAERARARALISLLAESHADIRKGADPTLLERYRDLQVQLSTAEGARQETGGPAGAAAGGDRKPPPDTEALMARIQATEAEIRRSSPAYAALTLPTPLGLDEIRKRVLDDDTVLLEYAISERGGWVWAVAREGMLSAALPAAGEIEEHARSLYESLSTAPSSGSAAKADAEAARLSASLLGPIAPKLSGAWRGRRLAIVLPGSLAYVPFGILPLPATDPSQGAQRIRVIDEHEVVSLPSASALDLIRRDVADRPPAPRRLALLADPVFAADDPRVTHQAAVTSGSAAPAPGDAVSRSALATGETVGFPRLPFSREEARSIASLLPGTGGNDMLMAIDFRASRKLAIDGDLAQYRILHFATHGLLNTTHPELSGLVLSLVDESGQPQDGFLRLQDIYNMRLSADLVVLSACRTALGRQIAGEGLVGLTRGFMYAGAPRVVASLWRVDDSATSELMREFYRSLLRDGMRPAASLRAAQRKLASDPRWSSPFYWSGFILEGEWR